MFPICRWDAHPSTPQSVPQTDAFPMGRVGSDDPHFPVLHKVPLLSSRPVSRNPGSTEALIKKTTKADGTLVVDDSMEGEALRNP